MSNHHFYGENSRTFNVFANFAAKSPCLLRKLTKLSTFSITIFTGKTHPSMAMFNGFFLCFSQGHSIIPWPVGPAESHVGPPAWPRRRDGRPAAGAAASGFPCPAAEVLAT